MKNLIKTMLIVLCGMMMVTSFAACGGDDDNGVNNGGNNGGNNGDVNPSTGISIANLAGNWQAIAAKGVSRYDGPIDTKEIWGLDSLDMPVLITINPNSTFVSYSPQFHNYYQWHYINGEPYPFSYTWEKRGPFGSSGEGSVLLIGNQLQLTDNYGSSYTVKVTITSLTSTRMVCSVNDESIEGTITYGRDGDGADYFKYTYVNHNPSVVGSWTLMQCTEKGAPIGSTMIFNSNGQGSIPGDGRTFTYTHNTTGEFVINFSDGWTIQGMISVTGTVASGYYVSGGSDYSFVLQKN